MPYDKDRAFSEIPWDVVPGRCTIVGLDTILTKLMRLQDNLRLPELDGSIDPRNDGELISDLYGEVYELEQALTSQQSVPITEELGDVLLKLMRIIVAKKLTLPAIVEALLAKEKIRAEINGKDSPREAEAIERVLHARGIL